MNLLELKKLVELFEQQATRQHMNLDDVQVVIASHKVGMLGGTPSTNVKSINLGFDWDKYEELSWKKSKIDRIVKENKRLKEQLDNK